MDTAKKLFEVVQGMGEILTGDLHIIHTGRPQLDGEDSYRVYHNSGYCFDIRKQWCGERNDCVDIFDYDMFFEWEGFMPLTEEAALRILLKTQKDLRL